MNDTFTRNNPGLTHAGCFVICLLLGFGAWHVSAVEYGASGWADSVGYIMAGKHIILEGRFPASPASYEAFMASGAAVFNSQALYPMPNIAFVASIGLLGLIMGEFTLICGVLVNLGLSLLFVACAYWAGVSLFRDRATALVFTVTLLIHQHIFVLLGQPLTDPSLLFFSLASAWAMLKDRIVAAGILLGAGFLFREQALIFFPLFPLLHHDVVSLKSYTRILFRLSLGFLPFLFLAKGLAALLSAGAPLEDFYAAHAAKHMGFSLERLSRFCSHAGAIFRIAWAPLTFFAYFALRRQVSAISVRLVAVGVIHNLIVAFLWSYKSLPQRYYAYSIALFTIAALLPAMNLKHRSGILALFCILAAAGHGPSLASTLRDFTRPDHNMAATVEAIRSPLATRKAFPKGSLLLSKDEFLAEYATEGTLPVMAPPYEEFVKHNNEAFDGIMMRNGWQGWTDRPEVRDAHGVRFRKLELPGVRLTPELLFYTRVK